jgi:hypothetical protein
MDQRVLGEADTAAEAAVDTAAVAAGPVVGPAVGKAAVERPVAELPALEQVLAVVVGIQTSVCSPVLV